MVKSNEANLSPFLQTEMGLLDLTVGLFGIIEFVTETRQLHAKYGLKLFYEFDYLA